VNARQSRVGTVDGSSATAISVVWIIPILAAVVAVGIAVQRIMSEGPTITIIFKAAEGMEAGKTFVKYKDVNIGQVTAVKLSNDYSKVEVTAKIDKSAAGLMVEDAKFWVVEPRVTLSGVSGLGTLLSGNYIGFEVGKSDKPQRKTKVATSASEVVSIRALAQALDAATRRTEVCITRLPLGWDGEYAHFRHPLDYVGLEGGGGVGAGPGITVGAALALKGSGRLPVAIMGDGDFLMGCTALWTATHYQLPCLILVANNRSFFNDELHQERVAKARGRPVENRWIGQRIDEPDIDLAMMARAQGAEGIGPVAHVDELAPAIERGVRLAQGGAVCVVDVRVLPGNDTNLSGSQSAHKR